MKLLVIDGLVINNQEYIYRSWEIIYIKGGLKSKNRYLYRNRNVIYKNISSTTTAFKIFMMQKNSSGLIYDQLLTPDNDYSSWIL